MKNGSDLLKDLHKRGLQPAKTKALEEAQKNFLETLHSVVSKEYAPTIQPAILKTWLSSLIGERAGVAALMQRLLTPPQPVQLAAAAADREDEVSVSLYQQVGEEISLAGEIYIIQSRVRDVKDDDDTIYIGKLDPKYVGKDLVMNARFKDCQYFLFGQFQDAFTIKVHNGFDEALPGIDFKQALDLEIIVLD